MFQMFWWLNKTFRLDNMDQMVKFKLSQYRFLDRQLSCVQRESVKKPTPPPNIHTGLEPAKRCRQCCKPHHAIYYRHKTVPNRLRQLGRSGVCRQSGAAGGCFCGCPNAEKPPCSLQGALRPAVEKGNNKKNPHFRLAQDARAGT